VIEVEEEGEDEDPEDDRRYPRHDDREEAHELGKPVPSVLREVNPSEKTDGNRNHGSEAEHDQRPLNLGSYSP